MPNYKNWATVRPIDLQLFDAIALKVVAVAGGGHEWAAYQGFSDWSDDNVAASGDKISAEAAEALFPQFKNADWRYRS